MPKPHAPDAAAPPDQALSGLDMGGALALLHGSPCAMALCRADGRLLWCNAALLRAMHRNDTAPLGLAMAELLALSPHDAQRLQARLRDASGGEPLELCAHHATAAPSWWCVHVAALADGRHTISLLPLDEQRRHAQQASRLGELLDLTQDFGRLAVWERDVRSLKGRWDRHMYRFWGLSEGDGTPDFALATKSIVAEDRAAFELAFRNSIRRAGTYSHRYRVRTPDGVVRRLHSQWVVKDGDNGRPAHVLGILMDDTEAWALARSHGEAVEQLSLAVELGRIAVWRTDLRTSRVQFSGKASELLGMAGRYGDMGSAEVLALAHPDDLQSLTAALEQALTSGQPVDVEARFRHADGGWRHLLTRRVLQRDADGKPLALLGVGLDLSERVESSRRETELVRQFELTARAAGIGYWSIKADTGLASWSEQTFVLHGLPVDAQALTMPQWLQRFAHADDREAVRQRFFAWLKSGRPNLEQEFRIVRLDGEVRQLLSYSRFEGPPGAYDFFGVLMDVTERGVAEMALREAGERAALATRGAGMGAWEQDLLSGSAYWDEQMWRLRGLEPRAQAPSAEQRMAMVHPDDREAIAVESDRAMGENRLSILEFRVRWPDGQWRWLASRATNLRDAAGRPVRRIGVNWDITDARNAQLAREAAALAQRESQAKSQFLSRMSHELRTPLNAVLGFTQLLLADGEKGSGDTRRRRLVLIESAGQHLLTLIDDVLDLSRLEGGEMRITAQPVPLADLVAQTLPLVARLARQHKVRLRTGELDAVVLADPTRLRQVLLNLLTNALKYNREGGQVLVEAQRRDATVALRISDTGMGMDAQQVGQAFEPFNRLGRELEGIEGTGIGLAIVKSLVERMGGTVQLQSTPGEGSCFEVLLPDAPHPAATPDASTRHEVAPPRAAPAPGRLARLLYIEDNPVNLMIVQELLARRTDLQFDSAVDGLSGVARAVAGLPDLVLVDMQLPDIHGLEVLRRLRANAATAAIPCIALSANAMPADIKRALQAGFADYWTKPLDFDQFMRSLEARLGLSPSGLA